MKPGEVVIIDDNGIQYMTTIQTMLNLLSFHGVYPTLHVLTLTFTVVMFIQLVREWGAPVAREFKHEADIMVGVPIPSLQRSYGFTEESGLPNEMGLIKNQCRNGPLSSRLKNCAKQVRMKLSAVSGVVKGKHWS